jgi:hypothetical protein
MGEKLTNGEKPHSLFISVSIFMRSYPSTTPDPPKALMHA